MGADKLRFDGTGTVVDSDGNLYQGGTKITATAAEINKVADGDLDVQALTASGAVTPGVRNLTLAANTAVIAATIASAAAHAGLFTITDASVTGTAAHTVTIASGTFDGTNYIATLNAPAESLIVAFDSDGDGTIVVNTGSVALATT